MREFRRVLGLFSAGLMACGGSSNSGSPDARSIDAGGGGNTVCAQPASFNITTALDFTNAGQAPGTVAQAGGQLEVDVLVTTNQAETAGFIMAQVNNAGLFSTATGKAGRFEKPPTLGTYALDADDSFGFGIDFVDGITQNADNTVTIKPTQVQVLDLAAGGMVKLDLWSPAATPGGTSTISATITNAKFKGFNVLADGSLSQTGNGCDITVQKLQFTNLNVKWQTAAFPAITAPVVSRGHGARTFDRVAVFHLDQQ